MCSKTFRRQINSYHLQSETQLKKIRKFNPTLEYLVKQNQSHGVGKLVHQGAICCLKKELSMIYGTINIHFRKKIFLFVKIEI